MNKKFGYPNERLTLSATGSFPAYYSINIDQWLRFAWLYAPGYETSRKQRLHSTPYKAPPAASEK